jgi:16S rRNA (uracil1498-N3)-methyltransferase
MAMFRFFCPNISVSSQIVIESLEDIHKIRSVLRLKVGDEILIFSGDSSEHRVRLEKISEKRIEGSVQETLFPDTELPFSLQLILSPPKSRDIYESILKKAVELGVTHIAVFKSERCFASFPLLSARVSRVIKDALEQSLRVKPPVLYEVSSLQDVYDSSQNSSQNSSQKFVCDSFEKNIPLLSSFSFKNNESRSLVIGPEGGFSQKEIESFQELGYLPVSLGKRVLRTETAVVAGLFCVSLSL